MATVTADEPAALRVNQILADLGIAEVYFPSETPEERDAHIGRIITKIAFGQGRKDSQMWVGRMDGEKERPQILGDMIINQTLYPEKDGLSRGPYHQVFMDLAIVEGATGLDLTSEGKLKTAVAIYWKAVQATIRMFKQQYQVRKEDAASAQEMAAQEQTPTFVDAPPLAMEQTNEQEISETFASPTI